MRFEVPQFIEIEDKIFGPLTWRQFLYLGGGLGMATVMFFTLPIFLFILFGIPLSVLAGALSFYPVNNRPFSFFLEAIINYVSSQRLYLWRQKKDIVHRARPDNNKDKKGQIFTPTSQQKQKKGITSMARRLELQALQKSE